MKNTICVLCCVWLLGSPLLRAQGAAFLGRFEHQTEVPYAYPNYFENQTWVNQLMDKTKEALRQRYNITQLDYKRRGTVNFIPGFRLPGDMKAFAGTGYDVLVSIVSRLETGLDNKKMKEEEGALLIFVEIWRPNERRIFKNRAKVKFVIMPQKNELAEVMISEEDFLKMYEDCLQAALQVQAKPTNYVFQQPAPLAYTEFIGSAELVPLIQKERTTFQLGQNTTQLLKMDMQAPYQQEKVFGREAVLQNPFEESEIKLSAALHTNQTFSIQSQAYQDNTQIGNFFMLEKPEAREITGYFGETAVRLSRGFLSGIVKVEIESKLVAILVPVSNTANNKQEQLNLYFLPKLTEALKAKVCTLLLLEILSEAVLRYYRLETGSKG